MGLGLEEYKLEGWKIERYKPQHHFQCSVLFQGNEKHWKAETSRARCNTLLAVYPTPAWETWTFLSPSHTCWHSLPEPTKSCRKHVPDDHLCTFVRGWKERGVIQHCHKDRTLWTPWLHKMGPEPQSYIFGHFQQSDGKGSKNVHKQQNGTAKNKEPNNVKY